MCHGNAGVGGPRNRRGDARDDLKGNASLGEPLGLLAAAPKYKRVSPLEAHHDRVRAPVGDQQVVYLVLRLLMTAGLFPYGDQKACRGGVCQEVGRGQSVVQNDIGDGDEGPSLHRDKVRVTGPGSDKIDGHVFISVSDVPPQDAMRWARPRASASKQSTGPCVSERRLSDPLGALMAARMVSISRSTVAYAPAARWHPPPISLKKARSAGNR